MIRLNRSQLVEHAYVLLAFLIGDESLVEDQEPSRKGHHYDRIHYSVWKFCDALFRVVARVNPLNREEPHLFCIARHRHWGRPFAVDGVYVRRFDPILEIHMNNQVLGQVIREEGSVVSLAARLIRETRRSLPALAECVTSGNYGKAKILYGTTLIHRGVERFGFSTHPIQSRTAQRFLAWYLRNILRMENPSAYHLYESRPEIFTPKIVAISKERLLQVYGGNCTSEIRASAEVSTG